MATLEETLRSLGLSAARGIPQLATGFVDLAALPFTATGMLKPEEAVGSTAYLTSKGLLPPEQQGLLNQTTELLSGAINPATAAKAALAKGGLLAAGTILGKPLENVFNIVKRDASDIFGSGAEKIRYTDPKSGGTIEILSKPDKSASVLSLEVPEKFRGQKIGESLQARVMQDFPEMQGQISSKAAAKTAYRLGRRPVGQPNATLDDVFKAIDQDSSVNLVSPEMQKRFSGSQTGGLLGATEDLSYKGSHTAPNANVYGATIDNLGGIMPMDVYSSKGTRLYGIGNPEIDSQWFSAAYRAKGKPDAEITVYRAVPKGVKNINNGDWVTTSKRYAQDHGESALNGEYEIITKKVKAKTLSSEGYPYEFGYNE
jgi:hypothetical protein